MRFPSFGVILFVLVWVIIGAVPSLRQQTLRGSNSSGSMLSFPPLPNLETALRETPNDPFLRSQDLIRQWTGRDRPDPFFQEYDALIAQNPARLDLWRNRLRLSTRGPIVNQPRTIKNLRLQAATMRPPPRVPSEKLWMNPAQLQRVCDQARRGGRLAPNDGFFPFVEAMALCGLLREKEALMALQKVAECSTFNDGAADEARQQIAFRSKHEILGWDEKMLISMLALYPHFSQMRAVVHELAYSGVDEYRAGRKAEAWRRWDIVFRATRAVRIAESQGPHAIYIGLLVGEAMEATTIQIVLKGTQGYDPKLIPKYPAQGVTRDESTQMLRERAAEFERFARREGQQELAKLSRQEIMAIEARKKIPMFNGTMNAFDDAMGWKTAQARATLQLAWFGWQTLILAGVGTVGLVCCLWTTRGGRESRVSKSTVWNLSVFLGSLWLGIAFWASTVGAGLGSYMALNSLMASESVRATIPFLSWEGCFQWFLNLTIAGIALFYLLGRRRARQNQNAFRGSGVSPWLIWQVLAWLLASVLTLLFWFDGLESNATLSHFNVLMPLWLSTVALALFLTWRGTKQGEPNQPQTFSYACCTALGLGCSVLLTRQHSDVSLFAGFFLGIAMVGSLVWSICTFGSGFRPFIATLRGPVEACGRVMANLALTLSVAYLVASLALWPARTEMNRKVDEFIRMGEIDWMRAQK